MVFTKRTRAFKLPPMVLNWTKPSEGVYRRDSEPRDQEAQSAVVTVWSASMPDEYDITIFGRVDADLYEGQQQGQRGWLRTQSDEVAIRNTISTSQLRSSMIEFVNAIAKVVEGTPEILGRYGLTEIVLSAEISASGRISIVGSGVELGTTGGLQLTFTRRDNTLVQEDTRQQTANKE
jgi:hypothetical protein